MPDRQKKSILDVIQKEYPEKYKLLLKNFSLLFKMFTRDEWLSILTKSRASFEPNKPKKQK
jgi:uncharacterized protein YbbC (DUF1343 family)